jgi:DNA-binding response OmpR family regulator
MRFRHEAVNDRLAVLVVDDDALFCATLAQVLAMAGYSVLSAEDGEEALAIVHRNHPAVVLLETGVLPTDCSRFAAAIKQSNPTASVLLTTPASEVGLCGRQIPVAGFIPKPFLLGDLLAELGRVCPTSV